MRDRDLDDVAGAARARPAMGDIVEGELAVGDREPGRRIAHDVLDRVLARERAGRVAGVVLLLPRHREPRRFGDAVLEGQVDVEEHRRIDDREGEQQKEDDADGRLDEGLTARRPRAGATRSARRAGGGPWVVVAHGRPWPGANAMPSDRADAVRYRARRGRRADRWLGPGVHVFTCAVPRRSYARGDH